MEIIVSGRRGGKTNAALEWVMQAKATASYPFWDRVLLSTTVEEADRLRRLIRQRAVQKGWSEPFVELTHNLVYCVEEWQRANIGQEPVDVMIDNADLLLRSWLRHSRLKGVTMTGEVTQP